MGQLKLFEVQEKPDVSRLVASGTQHNIELAYFLLKGVVGKYRALIEICKQSYISCWIKLFDEFEDSNLMHFLSVRIQGLEISAHEGYDTEGYVKVQIGSMVVDAMQIEEDYVFDDENSEKVKKNIFETLASNQGVLNELLP